MLDFLACFQAPPEKKKKKKVNIGHSVYLFLYTQLYTQLAWYNIYHSII